MKPKLTPRSMLLIIAAMFLLPLVLAWLMYNGTLEFRPESTRNKGILVTPPVPVDLQSTALTGSSDTAGLNEHWVVLYPLTEACETQCREDLAALRQVYLASGRHQPRIRLVVLTTTENSSDDKNVVETIFDKFVMVSDSTGQLIETLQSINQATLPENSLTSGNTYLIDPLGNIMMLYTAAADPNDLKQDLKRLLTWSKLDER